MADTHTEKNIASCHKKAGDQHIHNSPRHAQIRNADTVTLLLSQTVTLPLAFSSSAQSSFRSHGPAFALFASSALRGLSSMSRRLSSSCARRFFSTSALATLSLWRRFVKVSLSSADGSPHTRTCRTRNPTQIPTPSRTQKWKQAFRCKPVQRTTMTQSATLAGAPLFQDVAGRQLRLEATFKSTRLHSPGSCQNSSAKSGKWQQRKIGEW